MNKSMEWFSCEEQLTRLGLLSLKGENRTEGGFIEIYKIVSGLKIVNKKWLLIVSP